MTDHVIMLQLNKGAYVNRWIRALKELGMDVSMHRHALDSTHANVQQINVRLHANRKEGSFTAIRQWNINTYLHRFNRASPEQHAAMLSLAGIYTSPDFVGKSEKLYSNRHAYQRRYKVSVFHLKALRAVPCMQAALHSGTYNEGPDRTSPLWRRLERTAVRTLYTLGLDVGEVVIQAGEDGAFTVDQILVDLDPRDPASCDCYAQAIDALLIELHQMNSDPKPLLIGMDPEFILFDQKINKVIPASRFLDRRGEAGCDVLRIQGRLLRPLAELRPSPGREPREVVVHLLRAIRSAMVAIPNNGLLWQAGGMPQRGFPLGGHLHFSGIPLTSEFLHVLDNYLALPVAILEDSRSCRRRPKYGFLGDFRVQSHGGFEYRTLPSFLVSPLVTKGVVAVAALIARDGHRLASRPLENIEVMEAFYNGNKQVLGHSFQPLLKELVSTPSYRLYNNYIDPFLDALQSGKTWDESTDIRKLWSIY